MFVAFQRDPVSEGFDDTARRLLSRAYAAPGQWARMRLFDPSPSAQSFLAGRGITWDERDQVGSGLAKTRWARGFVRSLYYQHKWWSAAGGGFRAERRATYRRTGALVVEVGRAIPGRGMIPGGRAVRVKLVSGGTAKANAVASTPDRETWANHGPAWADPGQRDW